MSIDEKKICSTHTKEKEKSGTCCQEDEKEKAEQQTYEYKPKTTGEVIIDDTNDCEWCQ
jgi:hypothetical protein